MKEVWLRPSEAAILLGVTERHARRMCSLGLLAHELDIHGQYHIRMSAVRAWLEADQSED